MRKRLTVLLMVTVLLTLHCPEVQASDNWLFSFAEPVWCSPASCWSEMSVAIGGVGYLYIYGGASCNSGMVPEPDMSIEAVNCSVPVYLVASVFNKIFMYYEPFYDPPIGPFINADGVVAQATSYFVVGGLLYPYWQGSKDSDCFDDSVRYHIPGGTRC
jgi:hypothetical protein